MKVVEEAVSWEFISAQLMYLTDSLKPLCRKGKMDVTPTNVKIPRKVSVRRSDPVKLSLEYSWS